MDIKIDISVIIPVYNAEDTIRQSIDSVVDELSSTSYTWELILVDDASTDGSANIIREYESSFIHIISFSNNRGVSAARNQGIRMAKGEFLTFNDADDLWVQGKIQSQMNFMKTNENADLLGGVYGDDNLYLLNSEAVSKIDIKLQIFKNYFTSSTVIARKDFVCSTNLFDEKLKCAEDLHFFGELVAKGNCYLMQKMFIRTVIAKERWGGSGLSANIFLHEKGELFSIRCRYKEGYISAMQFIAAYIFSLLKFFRRCLVILLRKVKK